MNFEAQIGPLSDSEDGPLYLRLQRHIRQAIHSGTLTSGMALPPERELCSEFGFSRVTIRKAIDGLVEEHLLERRQGAGTFVADVLPSGTSKRVEKSFTLLSSFSEDMISRGRKPHSSWLDRSEGPASPEELMALGLLPGTRVFRFNRIRFADGETMALERAVVPTWALSSLSQVTESLYAALDVAGLRPARALQRIRATTFNAEDAALLNISEGDPCLFIERRAYLRDGRAVEATYCYYRGDSYDLVTE